MNLATLQRKLDLRLTQPLQDFGRVLGIERSSAILERQSREGTRVALLDRFQERRDCKFLG
jgi:hypothetical protein